MSYARDGRSIAVRRSSRTNAEKARLSIIKSGLVGQNASFHLDLIPLCCLSPPRVTPIPGLEPLHDRKRGTIVHISFDSAIIERDGIVGQTGSRPLAWLCFWVERAIRIMSQVALQVV